MSKQEHSWDAENMPTMHTHTVGAEASIVEGAGACLNRHNAGRNKSTGFLTKSSCNYRWQAFRRALDTADKAKYNWPAYESIQELVQKTQRGKARKTIDLLSRTPSGTRRHPVPSEDNKAWDITAGGENFQTRCTRPYWHESHHIIPDGAFQAAIAEAAAGEPLEPVYVRLIRGGLLREKYNLNHTHNMIILPMAKEVAFALGLPRHRVSRTMRSHEAYSDKVRTDLDKIFKPVQSDAKKHRKKPDYADCKKQLMDLSGTYRKGILDAGESMKATGEKENNALEDAFEADAAAGSL
ncbi:AHH domain-containing protein [Corallococcus sp. BB11-1]|uniref:AHH domain-containing protein n=1 Tax=Corallococcus sp. BB11-1 TaxID=2996783 RepID=UPI00226F4C70|nr:AHH domain-containing protein [Corallococcus sp. BB11-1]MCY1034025.1 AHH domain-containing protein [Corallococcus sp. BB11-1]